MISNSPGNIKFFKDKNPAPLPRTSEEIRIDRLGNWFCLFLLFLWLFLSLIVGQIRFGNILIDSETQPFFYNFFIAWIILAMFTIIAYLKRRKIL